MGKDDCRALRSPRSSQRSIVTDPYRTSAIQKAGGCVIEVEVAQEGRFMGRSLPTDPRHSPQQAEPAPRRSSRKPIPTNFYNAELYDMLEEGRRALRQQDAKEAVLLIRKTHGVDHGEDTSGLPNFEENEPSIELSSRSKQHSEHKRPDQARRKNASSLHQASCETPVGTDRTWSTTNEEVPKKRGPKNKALNEMSVTPVEKVINKSDSFSAVAAQATTKLAEAVEDMARPQNGGRNEKVQSVDTEKMHMSPHEVGMLLGMQAPGSNNTSIIETKVPKASKHRETSVFRLPLGAESVLTPLGEESVSSVQAPISSVPRSSTPQEALSQPLGELIHAVSTSVKAAPSKHKSNVKDVAVRKELRFSLSPAPDPATAPSEVPVMAPVLTATTKKRRRKRRTYVIPAVLRQKQRRLSPVTSLNAPTHSAAEEEAVGKSTNALPAGRGRFDVDQSKHDEPLGDARAQAKVGGGRFTIGNQPSPEKGERLKSKRSNTVSMTRVNLPSEVGVKVIDPTARTNPALLKRKRSNLAEKSARKGAHRSKSQKKRKHPHASSEPNVATEQPMLKKKRGRPVGSKNKPKVAATSSVAKSDEHCLGAVTNIPPMMSLGSNVATEQPSLKKKRGRPAGSKNRPKVAASSSVVESDEQRLGAITNIPPMMSLGSNVATEQPSLKKKGGRPVDSKNRHKVAASSSVVESEKPRLGAVTNIPPGTSLGPNVATEQPMLKKKRGRPVGSKNRPKVAASSSVVESEKPRLGAVTNIPPGASLGSNVATEQPSLKKKRGRPVGSKNRPKVAASSSVAASDIPVMQRGMASSRDDTSGADGVGRSEIVEPMRLSIDEQAVEMRKMHKKKERPKGAEGKRLRKHMRAGSVSPDIGLNDEATTRAVRVSGRDGDERSIMSGDGHIIDIDTASSSVDKKLEDMGTRKTCVISTKPMGNRPKKKRRKIGKLVRKAQQSVRSRRKAANVLTTKLAEDDESFTPTDDDASRDLVAKISSGKSLKAAGGLKKPRKANLRKYMKCGDCLACCLTKNCGRCVPCMREFGDEGTINKECILRVCLKPVVRSIKLWPRRPKNKSSAAKASTAEGNSMLPSTSALLSSQDDVQSLSDNASMIIDNMSDLDLEDDYVVHESVPTAEIVSGEKHADYNGGAQAEQGSLSTLHRLSAGKTRTDVAATQTAADLARSLREQDRSREIDFYNADDSDSDNDDLIPPPPPPIDF